MKYILIIVLLLSSCTYDHLLNVKKQYLTCYVKEFTKDQDEQIMYIWCKKCNIKPTMSFSTKGNNWEEILLRAKSRNRDCFVTISDYATINVYCDQEALKRCFGPMPHRIVCAKSNSNEKDKSNSLDKKRPTTCTCK